MRVIIVAFVVALAPLAALPQAALANDRATEILETIDDLWRGDSATAVATMHVKTANYQRTMKMQSWAKGKEKTLMRILEPIKEKGTATLKSDENIYTYLPKTDRTIKLTSGMMGGSWMGSHFTNDDLVQESRRSEDYDISLTFEGERNGRTELEFTLIPKEDAAVVWGKLVVLIWQDGKDYIPIEETYFDEDMVVARKMTFTEVKKLGDRRMPAVMTMVPADKPDEFTRFVYESIEFNVPLDDALFSVSRLRKRR